MDRINIEWMILLKLMQEYQPILSGQSKKTETYRIANLFYVALIGGIFAVAFIGLKNARMLHLPRPRMWKLLIVSVAILAGKILVVRSAFYDFGLSAEQYGLSIYKLPDLLLFIVIYHFLKVPYRLHMVYHSEYRHMAYHGMSIYICFISLVIDIIVVSFLFS